MKAPRFKFSTKAKKLFKTARYKILWGGRGGGKTYDIADYCLYRAMTARTRIACCRDIQNSIKDSVHQILSERINDLGLLKYFTITEKSIRSTVGSEFIFKGLRHNKQDI